MTPIELVTTLDKEPASCGVCGTVPCTADGDPKPMIDTHVDVNWGENLYICEECIGVIAGLYGYQTEEEHIAELNRLKRDHEEHLKSYEELKGELKKERKRNKAIEKGKKALREKQKAEA